MKSLVIWLVVLSSLGGGAYWAYQKWPDKVAFWKTAAPAAQKPARATTATVTSRNISFAVTAAGDIGPAEQVSVRPEVGGIIAALPVDIGDIVKKDQILFTLDDRDLQTERSARQTDIDGAQLKLDKSKRDFERSQKLYAEKLISQELYEDTKTEFDLAKNALEIARKALSQVEDKLVKTKIVAPFDCTILTRPVSVGQAVSGASGVNSGTEVLTIANLKDMIINAHINQADVTRLRVNQEVQVEIEAVPGLKLTGNVDRIAPQATIKNNIKGFATRILLKNDDGRVRPGMTATLSIPLVNVEDVLAVPLAAVFTEQGEHFVVLKKGESLERRTVQIGVTDYDYAEVQKGLAEGDLVVLELPAGMNADSLGGSGEKPKGKGGAKGGKKAASAGKTNATTSTESKAVVPKS